MGKNEREKKRSFVTVRKVIRYLQARIALNKRAFIIYSVLRVLVILTAVRCLWTGNYESLMFCLLSLVLFLVPAFCEEVFQIEIPPLFEIIIYCFIFSAEILGEVNQYYTAIPGWDTMLHTLNGFLCAALGLSMVQLLNRHSKQLNLSPLYVSVMAFCFSMTIGVLWEFFEFGMDQMFHMDMQKDFIVSSFSSVNLDPDGTQKAIRMAGIERTILEMTDGSSYTIQGGYLDLGIIDTMKDLFVNFIGAVVFSVLGFIYEKNQEKNGLRQGRALRLTEDLIWKTVSDDEAEDQKQKIRKQIEKKRIKKKGS